MFIFSLAFVASVSTGSSTSRKPNFTGVWQLNLEKSKLQGQPVKQLLVKIEHEEPKIVQKILVRYANGNEQSMTFAFETTGQESTNSMGGAVAQTKAHWEGTELVIESAVKAGERELHFRDHWFLSGDAQILTMEHRDDALAGQISVLEKAPPSAVVRFDKTEK